MSNLMNVTHPYAHDLILAALDVCIAGYPIAIEIKPIESLQISGGYMLQEHKLYYNPVDVMNYSFHELCDIIHNIYLTYYLNKVPLACKHHINMQVIH